MNDRSGYQKAVSLRGGNIAVSASAGCGKTTTMIRRIEDIITKEKISVSKLLVVTFTKAAASEMKQRLKDVLVKFPEGSFEYSQAESLDVCDISTIHSFCSKVCTEFFNVADIPPDYTILEENDCAVYKNKIFGDTLKDYYDYKDADISELSRIFSFDRTDKGLLQVIGRLYDIIINLPQPEKYLTETAVSCCVENPDLNTAIQFFKEDIADAAEEYIHQLSRQISLCSKYFVDTNNELLENIIIALASIDKRKDIKQILSVLDNLLLVLDKRIGSKRNIENGSAAFCVHEKTKNLKTDIKKKFTAYKETLLVAVSDFSAVMITGIKKHISKLCEITLKAYKNYKNFKKENAFMDFNDLEYYTLKVLHNDGSRKILQNRYCYIFVDEFQDTNRIQDEIISLMENNGNIFIVGDFKQSIYRFRGAENEIFKEKTEENRFTSLSLDTNFRSEKGILDFINCVFSLVMKESFSLVNYSVNGMLKGGCDCTLSDGRPAVIVSAIKKGEREKEEFKGIYSVKEHGENCGNEDVKRAADEGAYIAEQIKKLIENKTKLILDQNEKQKRLASGKDEYITYDDITVLVRAKQTFTKQICLELIKAGIPVSAEFSYSINDYPEITAIISYLKLIDNFMQDIPLLASLSGPFGNFTEEEIAFVRLANKGGGLCEAVIKYANEQNDCLAAKLKNFIAKTERYLLLSKSMPCPRVIMKIIKDADYEGYLSCFQSDGAQRVNAFLNIIYKKPYSQNITQLLDYLENAADDIKLGTKNGLQLNRVHICTIHASKGLEYPVVFIAGCGEKFTFTESRQKIITHNRLGVAMDYYDNSNRTKYSSYIKKALSKKQIYEQVKEEINTLYVAMTRAKYRLYICGTADTEKYIPLFHIYGIKNASCYFDFILNVAMQDGKNAAITDIFIYSDFNFKCKYEFNIINSKSEVAVSFCDKQSELDIILPVTDYKYSESTTQPLKNSVTGITKEQAEEIAIPSGGSAVLFENAADTGTAYHKVLSLIDFDIKKEETEVFIQKLVKEKIIKKEQAEQIDCNLIYKVLSMPCLRDFKGEIYRELPFIIRINANEAGGKTDDKILVQGVIDLLIVSGNECKIIDYKFSSANAEYLKQKYGGQLELYKIAVQKVLGYNVVQKTLINIKNCSYINV